MCSSPALSTALPSKIHQRARLEIEFTGKSPRSPDFLGRCPMKTANAELYKAAYLLRVARLPASVLGRASEATAAPPILSPF